MNVGWRRVSFGRLLEDLLPQLAAPVVALDGDAERLGVLADAVVAGEIVWGEPRIAFQDRIGHGHPAKRRPEIDGLSLVLDLRRAAYRESGTAHQILGQINHFHVVRIGLIELQHRELGVVLGGDALVAEVAVDLEHALEAADHEPLEVQLRRDAQVQVGVERVVVGHERPGDRPAGYGMHHRGLDFQEAAVDEEPADVVDGARAGAKHLAAALVDDEVDVAAPVAGLHVGKPVVLLGQRQERLHEQPDRARLHRKLVGPGAEHDALDRDDIPEIEPLEFREPTLRQVVSTHVDLDISGDVAQMRERGLAHETAGHQPSRDRHGDRLVLQVLGGCAGEARMQVAGLRIRPEIVRVRLAAGAQLSELRTTLRRLVSVLLVQWSALRGLPGRCCAVLRRRWLNPVTPFSPSGVSGRASPVRPAPAGAIGVPESPPNRNLAAQS